MAQEQVTAQTCARHGQLLWRTSGRCWRCTMEEQSIGPLALQMQPKATRICGQTVVAMLIGEPVERVITQRFGHRHSTSGRQLRAALLNAGHHPADKWKRINGVVPLEARGVVSLRCSDLHYRWKHWIAVAGGVVYDPGRGWARIDEPAGALEHLGYPLGSVRAISYLEVRAP